MGSSLVQTLADALAARKRELDKCPVNGPRSNAFDPSNDCPQCGATTAGPCWLNVAANTTLVDVVKEIVKAEATNG